MNNYKQESLNCFVFKEIVNEITKYMEKVDRRIKIGKPFVSGFIGSDCECFERDFYVGEIRNCYVGDYYWVYENSEDVGKDKEPLIDTLDYSNPTDCIEFKVLVVSEDEVKILFKESSTKYAKTTSQWIIGLIEEYGGTK